MFLNIVQLGMLWFQNIPAANLPASSDVHMLALPTFHHWHSLADIMVDFSFFYEHSQ